MLKPAQFFMILYQLQNMIGGTHYIKLFYILIYCNHHNYHLCPPPPAPPHSSDDMNILTMHVIDVALNKSFTNR